MSSEFTLQGAYGRLRLQSNGGMLGPAEFTLPGRGKISPLTCPNWAGRKSWLPMLRHLCGDFVCIPYGAPDTSDALPEHWRGGAQKGIVQDRWFHGYSANSPWDISPDADDATSATMICLPPEPHPISRVTRRVSLLPDAPGYHVELSIHARRDVKFPLSLHPCFNLPDQAGALRLETANAGRGWTYPVPVVPDHSPIAPDARFDTLTAVPRADGGVADMSRFPPSERCEALLQLPAPDGLVRLIDEQSGYAIRFEYDADLLPCLVIWVSNHGRDEAPFDGGFRTLGIEAVAGAFDLGPGVSNWAQNPIAREGVATTIALSAGQKLTTQSTVTIEAV